MKKYFITGISGFVASHFLEHLNDLDEKYEVLGLDLNIIQEVNEFYFQNIMFNFIEINL